MRCKWKCWTSGEPVEWDTFCVFRADSVSEKLYLTTRQQRDVFAFFLCPTGRNWFAKPVRVRSVLTSSAAAEWCKAERPRVKWPTQDRSRVRAMAASWCRGHPAALCSSLTHWYLLLPFDSETFSSSTPLCAPLKSIPSVVCRSVDVSARPLRDKRKWCCSGIIIALHIYFGGWITSDLCLRYLRNRPGCSPSCAATRPKRVCLHSSISWKRGHFICTVSLWEIDSSPCHFWLRLCYNCSPRNQIMQTRSILPRVEATSKCKISRALRDKQDHRRAREQRKEPGEGGM